MADPQGVAVTPLFWHPDRGVYWMFDFDQNGQVVDKSPTYELIQRLPPARLTRVHAGDRERRSGRPGHRARGPRTWRCGPGAGGVGRAQAAPGGPDRGAGPAEEPTATPVAADRDRDACPAPTPTRSRRRPRRRRRPRPGRPVTTTSLPPAATATAPRRRPPRPAQAVAEQAAPPRSAASGSTTPRYMRIGNTDGGAVRLRGTPARAAPSIASVPPGTRVEAIGSSEQYEDLYWQLVRVPTRGSGAIAEGWIAIDFLTPSDHGLAGLTTRAPPFPCVRPPPGGPHLRP